MPASKSKSEIFKFKQFEVDQSGCAMKINTDGVLLGALAEASDPSNILDIGTGTGVIALMLAQRFPNATINAVEVDQLAAATAGRNFANSPFSGRLEAYPVGFEQFFESNPAKKYDLIVSNPPFYINSLKSPEKNKQLAKHADHHFFEKLVRFLPNHITDKGICCMILPPDTAGLVKGITYKAGLFIKRVVSIHSFDNAEPHREILTITKDKHHDHIEKFTIYDQPKSFSQQYVESLKDFFTIF